MKKQVLSLPIALLFTATLCACATETTNSPAVPITPAREALPTKAEALVDAVTPVSVAAKKEENALGAMVSRAPDTLQKPTEPLSEAQKILEFARAQLPKQPIQMSGTLKEWAKNDFMKQKLTVEMDLNWGADPANATYRIRDEKSGQFQTLEIQWLSSGPVFQYSENGTDAADFNPNKEIDGLGVTWADLSFSFLWTQKAETVNTDKKLGRDCYVISVPRGENHLLLWIEQETGRLLGAREETPAGALVKEIKVVSVKEFDDIWMVKDLDIIRPEDNSRTSLRIDSVESVEQ